MCLQEHLAVTVHLDREENQGQMADQDLKDNQARLDSPVKLDNAVNQDPVDLTDSPEAQVFTSIHKAT